MCTRGRYQSGQADMWQEGVVELQGQTRLYGVRKPFVCMAERGSMCMYSMG